MKRSRRMLAPAIFGVAAIALVMTLGAGSAGAKKDGRPVDRVVLFSSDGMRPDLMEKYAKAGYMPTYRKLMKHGVTGDNGMVQAFPPNTGVGWYTMATGTYPSEHGSTNNTFFRSGDTFSNRTSFSGAGVLQADTIANAAERAGKKVAQIDWVGGAAANIDGPTVDFTNFYSNRGVLVGQVDTVEQQGSAFFGVTYQIATVVPAVGWTGVPLGDPAATPKETTWTINSTFAAQNPNRTYNVYFYDSVNGGGVNYDHAIVSPVGKTGASPSLDLEVGDFLPLRLTGANGLIGARAGQTVGHYIKLISLAPDASNFKLYDTSLARAIAKCGTVCNSLPAGGAGEDRLEKYIADNLLPWAAADFAPEEAGVVDEDTYIQQGRDLERAYSLQVINFILHDLQPNTDLAMVGYPFTDEVSHQFMGLVTPTDPDGSPNPCYDATPRFDDTECTPNTAHRVAIREGYIRSAYQDADEKLAITRELMGGNPTTFAGSDHGFAPQRYAVNATEVLNNATVHNTATNTEVSLHASNGSASNCAAAVTDLTKACWAGGTIQIYVNTTLPAGITYAAVRAAITSAFDNLTDPAKPTRPVISRIMQKEELRNVDGSDSLHPNRSGDVVVVTAPPYQSDAGTTDKEIFLSHFFGQHGYLPNLVDLKHNINMHATFVAGGPGFKHKKNVKGLRAIDIAPTLAFLMNIPGPQNARGRILYDILENTEDLTEVTILDISDYHGQLIPLSESADTLGPSFNIGGSAFLKKWFDIYEAEAALNKRDKGAPNVIEMAAGDSVGATPPISNFFGDVPTIEVMNMMGIDIDGLGNHNFDKGAAYMQHRLIDGEGAGGVPAQYPFVSANVVDASGNTPPEWSPSHVFTFEHGVKLGFVGFTNDDAPTLVAPGAFDPFVTPLPNSTAAVNAVAAKLSKNVDGIVAMGHLGATAGTLTDPTGPLVDLADHVTNVDAVIGDHTDQQVLTTGSNGVLTTENRSKGIRFTRVRLVIGPGKQGIVYKTADFHKPWDIGITPDTAIQAKIDFLNGLLAPIFNTEVGKSTVVIPRSDVCGPFFVPARVDGRACESLIGDLTTDAIRTKYGTDFALTNSGGLRADLTCPVGATDPNSGDFCPPAEYPIPDASGHYPITRGQVLGVLPFGNVAATLTINGAELKDYLETAVSSLPANGNGRFGQVSGLCFTFDIQAAPIGFTAAPTAIPGTGHRVLSAVRQAADGTCTGAAIDLTSGSTYKLATNDFTASGGDGYQNFKDRMTTQGILDQDLADYIAAQPGHLVSPAIQHRIHCTDSDPGTAPACPVNSP
jgi:2',3'-cyclic-nucleotide 2'-phosphodiesterase (5'-nucleotidase family)/predicted AlkP superfamily phosphohydrolase/phosphomutase